MRPWRLEDREAFLALFGDPRVIWWRDPPRTAQQLEEDLQRVVAEPITDGLGRFAAVRQGENRPIGNVVLQPAPFVEGVEVGYHFAHAEWGKGFASEGARAAMQHGFESLGLEEIWAIVALQNPASLRIVEKLGMRAVRDMDRLGLPHRLFRMGAGEWNTDGNGR